jgi:hypothetical protein
MSLAQAYFFPIENQAALYTEGILWFGSGPMTSNAEVIRLWTINQRFMKLGCGIVDIIGSRLLDARSFSFEEVTLKVEFRYFCQQQTAC